jgi:glycosyltransferase involved in cell wall biosynthesis
MEEAASPVEVFLKARKLFREEKVEVAFLPSYSPARYFALFAAAKSLGIRTVMMNESHAGTEQATGWKRWIKRQIVKQFDAAFVGGEPHKRHFASLGIPADKIFTGYDAVDGEFFAQRADEIRAAQKRSQDSGDRGQSEGGEDSVSVFQNFGFSDFRKTYGFPQRYFLSLGRMVEKKNLATLVSAYARYAEGVAGDGRSQMEDGSAPMALVFVGSGELEGALRQQARALGLRVVDRTDAGPRTKRLKDEETKGPQSQAENCTPNTENSVESDRGAVYFYGFRQIEENPVFYALAEAFVLPSLKEEWGLVVNEAMAAGLPVIVSRTAGCAEDLLPGSESWQCSVGSIQFGEEKTTDDCKPFTDDSLEERSNGFVFDPRSVEALATALVCVAETGDVRLEMGKRSREVVAKFSCENFARQALRAAEAAGA